MKKNNNVFGDLEKLIDDTEDKMKSLENKEMTPEEMTLAQEALEKQLSKIGKTMSSLDALVSKKIRKKEKISKYSLGSALRKHKMLIQDVTKVDEIPIIIECENEMYATLMDVLNEENQYRKMRLGQLYSVGLRKNFNSFRSSVIEIFDDMKGEENVTEVLGDFYVTYMNMICETVSQTFNKEVDERKKAEAEAEAKRNSVKSGDEIYEGVVKEGIPKEAIEEESNV